MDMEYDVIPPSLAIEAMKNNGYKNMAYGIAELVDNSIQANARKIRIYLVEDREMVGVRRRDRIVQIGVHDDGCGMPAETLRQALMFGNGTRLNDRSGIGRFGMGLPNSSVGFARHLQVWSWQAGPNSIKRAELDVDAVRGGTVRKVGEPDSRPFPEGWPQVIGDVGKTGTFVLWDRLIAEACTWRSAAAICKNSESLIGRIYREFLNNHDFTIEMITIDRNNWQTSAEDRLRPNDPLYLMTGTNTPAPWDSNPMFEAYGEPITHTLDGDSSTEVRLRFSIAKPEARSFDTDIDPGSRPYGKHAAHNVGVSIMRAGRELELDQSLVNDDPTERWWGCQVEFPPTLDDCFGVTNNKQTARHFSEVVHQFGKLGTNESEAQRIREELTQDGNPQQALLVEVVHSIKKTLAQMRRTVKDQRKGARTRKLPLSAELTATAITEERIRSGNAGRSDNLNGLSDAEREREIAKALEESGIEQAAAATEAAAIVVSHRRYNFTPTRLGGAPFFTVQSLAGLIQIKLNSDHPAYANLVEVLEGNPQDGESAEDLRERLERARKGLKLLLCSWARMEDEADAPERERLEDLRFNWGKMARQFLRPPVNPAQND
jgi:hypothetical protein